MKLVFFILTILISVLLVIINAHTDEVLCEDGRKLCENGTELCMDCCMKKLQVDDVGCWAGDCYCLIFT
ncbi:unnamed protein product [Callosobruchus maculatus]|uniref:Uncharacterized protein n=1 Tax=Callosobruchus maculatus TaxID=64391 RepID=A0A653D1B4_CALMS|nr:unnamed protein product [Callosobruchus maculatus]